MMTHHIRRRVLPFTAIVGQEKLKKALILNAINPNLNGVLIRGEKGTAKSTTVRALAELLPEVEVVEDCPFNCNPRNPSLQCDRCNRRYENNEELPVKKRKMKTVDLPLGATEDRVIGSIDIDKTIESGVSHFEPGILAEVNQGILYIDEVNLLDDHLVDILLDVAAMGVNVVEREGFSFSHPSKFILVGTMNPEEGELRPQLLDRFGLQVDVEGIKDIEDRMEIVRRVEDFEADAEGFSKRYSDKQEELRRRIEEAKERLKEVEISDELLRIVAEMCVELDVDGHRADILIVRTAKTIAAYNGRKNVNIEDIKEAAELVLPHRLRRKPFEETRHIDDQINEVMKKIENSEKDEQRKEIEEEKEKKGREEEKERNRKGRNGGREDERTFGIGASCKIEIDRKRDKKERIGSGRRAKTLTKRRGRYVKARYPSGDVDDIALDATLRASVIRSGRIDIRKEDLRERVREKRMASLIVFVVDASGSMAARRRMEAAKGAVFSLIQDAYQKRDKIGFVAFRGERAEVLLQPTSSVELAARCLRDLPTGRKTPLPDGLYKGLELLRSELRRNGNAIPIMVLVSDGKGNVPIKEDVRREVLSLAEEIRREGIHLVVIDTETGLVRMGYNREISEAAGGEYYSLDNLDLSSEEIAGKIRSLTET